MIIHDWQWYAMGIDPTDPADWALMSQISAELSEVSDSTLEE